MTQRQHQPMPEDGTVTDPIAEMTNRELSGALYAGPGNAGPAELLAAIDILNLAYNGALLGEERFRKALRMDGSRVYVDWRTMSSYGADLDNGFTSKSSVPRSAGILIRVACALAQGGMVPSEARTLYTALTALLADRPF